MTKLWCILIPGQGDIYAKASKEIAERAAAEHNQWLDEWYPKHTQPEREHVPKLEEMYAVVAPWPHSAKAHAEDLLKQEDNSNDAIDKLLEPDQQLYGTNN